MGKEVGILFPEALWIEHGADKRLEATFFGAF